MITSEQLGRAMVRVGKERYSHSITESSDLKKLGMYIKKRLFHIGVFLMVKLFLSKLKNLPINKLVEIPVHFSRRNASFIFKPPCA
ncbi:hypothetical protein COI55_13310 [Bacillus wiedmannii]|nr:hypothetical protein COI55_13310 [Bacillus wiedmannii]